MIQMILGSWGLALRMFLMMAIPILLFAGLYLLIESTGYKDSAYHKQTKKSFISIRFNIGAYGEYLIYKHLRNCENNGSKFLFNVYVPKENGETTEIDVLMIDKHGLFVFESKNYSGWIFGSEGQSQWTQTLPKGKGRSEKNRFFNPILQNKGHIKHLKSVVGEKIPMYSIVAFSDRCELKNVKVNSDVAVINRSEVVRKVGEKKRENAECLTEADILAIFNNLYPMTQVDNTVKEQHIAVIKEKTGAKKEEPEVAVSDAVPETAPAPEAAPEPAEAENDSMICPRCGKPLVVRVAKKGANAGNEFFGCSGYPHCRYVKTK